MRNSRLFCPAWAAAVLLSLFICLSCATSSPSTNAAVEDFANDVVPGAFLVEFSEDESLSTFYDGLRSGNIDFDHRMDLSNQLFKGASFTVKNHLTNEVKRLFFSLPFFFNSRPSSN
jgi:hypothetical protein